MAVHSVDIPEVTNREWRNLCPDSWKWAVKLYLRESMQAPNDRSRSGLLGFRRKVLVHKSRWETRACKRQPGLSAALARAGGRPLDREKARSNRPESKSKVPRGTRRHPVQ